jgi:hypothetical protein
MVAQTGEFCVPLEIGEWSAARSGAVRARFLAPLVKTRRFGMTQPEVG